MFDMVFLKVFVILFWASYILAYPSGQLTCIGRSLERSDSHIPTKCGIAPSVLARDVLREARNELFHRENGAVIPLKYDFGSAGTEEISFIETSEFFIIRVGNASLGGRMYLDNPVDTLATSYDEFSRVVQQCSSLKAMESYIPSVYEDILSLCKDLYGAADRASKNTILLSDSTEDTLVVSMLITKALKELEWPFDFFTIDLSCMTRTRVPIIIPLAIVVTDP